MAYLTGLANSYDELPGQIVSACTGNGWGLADGMLSKGNAFVRLYVSNTDQTAYTSPGSGILVQGGTGAIAGVLQNASVCEPRLGRPGPVVNFETVTWPATYHIHIFQNPDEVFVVLNFKELYHYYLAFGVSDVPGIGGSGLWIAGTATRNADRGNSYSGVSMNPTYGRAGGNPSYLESCAPFWGTARDANQVYNIDTIHCNVDGEGWKGTNSDQNPGALHAVRAAAPHVAMTPSNWNQDAPLMPIHVYLWRDQGKCSQLLQVRNARYMRVDNHEPGDIITLGTDEWVSYPFYRKNADQRDGGSYLNHSGTFGWAIKK